MNKKVAGLIFLLTISPGAISCLPDPVPYIPLLKIDGEFIQRPDLLTENHIAEVLRYIKRCSTRGNTGYIVLHGGVYLAPDYIVENKECVAEVTQKALEKPSADIELDVPPIEISPPN